MPGVRRASHAVAAGAALTARVDGARSETSCAHAGDSRERRWRPWVSGWRREREAARYNWRVSRGEQARVQMRMHDTMWTSWEHSRVIEAEQCKNNDQSSHVDCSRCDKVGAGRSLAECQRNCAAVAKI